jgi:DNA-directed RNA polymerase specialized sigma24 family protein
VTDRERLLDEVRPVSFAIAYRMLGSVSEAEDIVQEVLLRVYLLARHREEPVGHVCSSGRGGESGES